MLTRESESVQSFAAAKANIQIYVMSVSNRRELAERIKRHPSWYAVRAESGEWLFGPSKFIGYADMDADRYLGSYDRQDGRITEPVLQQWFGKVETGTPLEKELRAAFVEFAARYGKSPKQSWRVSVEISELESRQAANAPGMSEIMKRVVFDPDICGGRPRIAGTRMRVADIVGMIAEGASRDEIVADYPYLKIEDVAAALAYAALAVDHRVLRAA